MKMDILRHSQNSKLYLVMNSKCILFIGKLLLCMLLFGVSNAAIAQITKIKTVQEEVDYYSILVHY